MKMTNKERAQVLRARLNIIKGRDKDNSAIQAKLERKIAALEK